MTELSKRWLRIACMLPVLLLCGGVLAAPGQPLISPFKSESTIPEPVSHDIVALELTNADIPDAFKIISDISGWTIVPSHKLTGKLSFFAKDTSCQELLDALLMANDWVKVEEGNTIVVMTRAECEELYGPVQQVTRIFQSISGASSDPAAIIKPLLSKDGRVVTDALSGRIVVRDTVKRVEEIATVMAELHEGVLTEVLQLQHASVEDVSEVISSMASLPDGLRFDERTNQILLTDTASNIERIRQTLEKLDRQDVYFTRTFSLQHADCLDAERILREAFGDSEGREASRRNAASSPGTTSDEGNTQDAPPANRPASSAAPSRPAEGALPVRRSAYPVESLDGLAANQTITADPRINALIVTDTPDMLGRIEKLIEELDVEQKMHVYELNYASPEQLDLDEKLSGILGDEREHFAIDEVSKTVSFMTSAGKSQQILDLLKEWDKQPRQVYIEAKVFMLDVDDSLEVGTEFDAMLNELSSKVTPLLRTTTSFPGGIADSPASAIQLGDIDADGYQALLRLIESTSKAELLSNPKIIAMDGNPAQFRVATDQPFTEVSVTSAGDRTLENVRFIPVGVILRVLPNINGDGVISMDIELEVSRLREVRDGVPVVSRSLASSKVVVEQDHSIVIGGLISEENNEVKTGVPILMNIPLLGWFFRSTKVASVKSELVLVLTPSIASAQGEGPEGLVDGPRL